MVKLYKHTLENDVSFSQMLTCRLQKSSKFSNLVEQIRQKLDESIIIHTLLKVSLLVYLAQLFTTTMANCFLFFLNTRFFYLHSMASL